MQQLLSRLEIWAVCAVVTMCSFMYLARTADTSTSGHNPSTMITSDSTISPRVGSDTGNGSGTKIASGPTIPPGPWDDDDDTSSGDTKIV